MTRNKLIEATDTSFNVAAYRYSTRDYLGLNDALELIDDAKFKGTDAERNTMNNFSRMKNQVTVSMNQPLQSAEVDYGSFYLSATGPTTGQATRAAAITAGLWQRIFLGSMSINLQRTRDEEGEKDDSLYINFNIPLENLLGGERRRSGFSNLSTQMRTDFNGGHQLSMNSSGSSEDNKLNYSVNTGYTMQKRGKHLRYWWIYQLSVPMGRIFPASASANNDSNRQYSLSTDGGFVFCTSGGLTFTNDNFGNSDAIVLVKARR